MVARARSPIQMDPHPLLSVFPRMGDEEFAAFRADVDVNGQREPAWTFRGHLIDGRERQRACRELRIEFAAREWDGTEAELAAFIVSLNLQRRHLTESQRAMVAARLATAKCGDNQHSGRTGRAESAVGPIGPTTKTAAAQLLNVSANSVKRARAVLDRGVPELVEAVERDRLSVSSAAAIAQLPAAKQREMLAEEPAAPGDGIDSRPPRQCDDPDKYIRPVKGNKFQARPYDEGVRYDLGIFPTKSKARQAILDFWWGKLKPLPKFVKCIHGKTGSRYLAVVPVRLGEYESRDDAARAVEKWIRATFSKKAADEMLGVKEPT